MLVAFFIKVDGRPLAVRMMKWSQCFLLKSAAELPPRVAQVIMSLYGHVLSRRRL